MSRIIVRQENEANVLEFYASVFNSKSKTITENGKTFREVILPDAYSGADTSNTLATLFHDKNKIIGRSRSGTLTLEADDYGLKAIVNMGTTQLHKDTIEQVVRGDLDECSFIGVVSDWSENYEGGELIRYIKSVDVLRDVSIVSEGAYAGTNIVIREFMDKPIEKDEAREKEVEAEKVNEEAPIEETEKTPEKEEVEAPKEEEVEREDEDKEVEDTPEDKPKADEPEVEVEKEEVKRSINTKQKPRMNNFELIREAAKGNGGSVLITRAAVDGDTTAMAKLIPTGVGKLSVIGSVPIWQKMGVDYNPNAKGMYILPFQDPIIGEKLAELAPATGDVVTPDGNVIKANRFTVQKKVTLETIANADDAYMADLIAEMEKGCDRKISAEVYAKVLAGATEVAGGAITKPGFDLLQAGAEIEGEGSYLGSRKTFFEAKGVAVDAGSGVFLTSLVEADKGATYEGSPFFYSPLFEDGVKQKYVAYGDLSYIHIADYGMSEVIIDKVTLAGKGQIVLTVNKLADVALLNPNAFAKSPDLDAAV